MTKVIGQITLEPKTLYFLIESVEFRLAWYRANIPFATDESTRGDMENDAALLNSVLKMLKAESDTWTEDMSRRAGVENKPQRERQGLEMSDHRLTVTRKEDTFLVGRLDDARYSGVYLSPEYMARLSELSHAVGRRIEATDIAPLPDAVKNVIGVVDRLAKVHAAQFQSENGGTEEEKREIAAAQKKVDDAVRALRGFPGDNSDPQDTK
jgi:hypothetical protein